MTKLNLFEEIKKKSFLQWFVMEAMKHEIISDENYNPENVDVKFIINGVECPLRETIEYLGEQFDALVEDTARQLIKDKMDDLFFDKFNELSNKVREFEDDIDDKIESMLR